MTVRRARWAAALGVFALVTVGGLIVVLAGRSAGGPTSTLSASHVDVAVSVVAEGEGRTIVARFAPDSPGLHLYGPDIPDTGIDGAGRPTRVAVVGGGWAASRSIHPAADPTPFATALPGFSAPFSVFPDGAVTMRLPIERASGDAEYGARGDQLHGVLDGRSVLPAGRGRGARCSRPVRSTSVPPSVPGSTSG